MNRVAIPLAVAALVAQAIDLLSFVAVVDRYPVLLRFEVGPIASVHAAFGPLGAVAFKVVGVAFILACALVIARSRRRMALAPVALLLAAGVLGAWTNVEAYRFVEAYFGG